MSAITQKLTEFTKNVKLDQENLDLFNLRISKDPDRSRLIVEMTSQLGVDFEGDTIENVLATLSGLFLSGNSGK